jgi:midasin
MERLGHVASSTHVAHSGPVVLQHAHAYHQLSCKVAQALTEVVDAMDVARNLDFDVPPQLIGDVAGTQKDAQQHASRLEGLIAQLSRSSFSVMLQGSYAAVFVRDGLLMACAEERDALHSAASFFNLVTDRLRQWLADAPNLRHVFKPTSSWLQEQIIALPSAIAENDPAASHADNDRIIDLLLVTVQNMLVAQPAVPDVDALADETPDNYVRDQGRAVSQSTRALDLPLVISAANDLLRSVAQGPRAAIAPALGRALPFLERYAALARAHAAAQTAWARALLKFAFVLASTALRVARDGFCRPPDGDERGAEGGGDGAEMADGTGLGAGAGAENVSKEIEDEGQVEGLQGEEPPADAERQDGEDAVEMSEDFAGALQDVASEDGGADGEDDHDDEDGPEPEEQLGKLDPADPAAVDEKLWGDEAGPEEDGGEQKTEQDAAAKPQGESEMTAKEDDGKKPGKDKDAEKDGKQPDEPPRPEEDGEETAEEGAQEQDVEDPSGAGAPMDEHLQEGATLDLPEDMDLGEGQEAEDDADLPEDGDDDDVQMGEEDVDPSELPDAEAEERQATPTPDDRREGPTEDDEQADEPDAMRQAAEAEDEPAPDNEDEADRDDATAARPDVQSGAGEPGQDDQTIDHDVGESASNGQEAGTRRAAGENAGAEAEAQDET